MNVRPTAFFFTKCDIDSTGINELYSKAQDGYESTKLYAVSVVSLTALAALSDPQLAFTCFQITEVVFKLQEELRGMSQRVPGCHNGGFALYELMRNEAKSL